MEHKIVKAMREFVENISDIRAAQKALREGKSGPWSEVKKELNLD